MSSLVEVYDDFQIPQNDGILKIQVSGPQIECASCVSCQMVQSLGGGTLFDFVEQVSQTHFVLILVFDDIRMAENAKANNLVGQIGTLIRSGLVCEAEYVTLRYSEYLWHKNESLPEKCGRHMQPAGRLTPLKKKDDLNVRSYDISVADIRAGTDKRLTCMIRNIPNKYTLQMLLEFINETHQGQYDFVYLPIDFVNRCNQGYAFINFVDSRQEIFH